MDTVLKGKKKLQRNYDRRFNLLIPITLFLIILFAYPVFQLLLMSIVKDGKLTLEFYKHFFSSSLYMSIIWNTIKVSFSVTIITFILGYPVAYFLANASPKVAQRCFIFVLLPFWTSLLIRTYAWMVLLGRDGVINSFLLKLGIIQAPLPLIYNWLSVNIGMVHVLLPFMILPLHSVMSKIDRNLLTASLGLGANKFRTFIHIYFPLSLPGVLSGSLLVFILSMGYYITPALLGGGKVLMVSILIEEQVRQFLNWGFASSIAFVLLLITLIIFYLYNKVLGWDKTWT